MADEKKQLKTQVRLEVIVEQLLVLTEDLATTSQLTDADNAIMYLRHLGRSFT